MYLSLFLSFYIILVLFVVAVVAAYTSFLLIHCSYSGSFICFILLSVNSTLVFVCQQFLAPYYSFIITL